MSGNMSDRAGKVVQVAVGVLENPLGEILIARRPEHVHQGGLWEFPGGKVDAGETLNEALRRELWEELAIEVLATEPLISIRHDYADKSVLLQVRRVTRFKGDPRGNEGQPVRWVAPWELPQFSFPAANRPIVNALRLPDQMLVTGPANSPEDWLARLDRALDQGVALVQLRCPGLSAEEYAERLSLALPRCRARGVRLVANAPAELWSDDLDGLHLNSRALAHCRERPIPESAWLGASCHNDWELRRACELGADYVTLSPVSATGSHPGAEPMGWETFGQLAAQAGIPVYAQGGMKPLDLVRVKQAGGRGIAGISFAWPE